MPQRQSHSRFIPGIVASLLCGLQGVCPQVAYAQETVNAPDAQSAVAPDAVVAAPVKSLFFLPEEVMVIHQMMKAYLAQSSKVDTPSGGEDYLSQLRDIAAKHKVSEYFTYPQFFLESVVYHSPTDWSIWVNNQKITYDTVSVNTGLRVVSIDKSRVTLKWQPQEMDRIESVWQKNGSAAPEVAVDHALGTVTFTMHPNQTFSSYVMRVLEGKRIPVTVKNSSAVSATSASAAEAAPALPPLPAPATGAPVTINSPKGEEGLNGLLDSYNHLDHVEP